MCKNPLKIIMVVAILISPISLAAEVEYRLTQRINHAISADVWDKHSSTDEDGEVVVAFYVDNLGKVSEITVVTSSPPGVWDSLATEQVENMKFSGAQFGYRQITFGYSKNQKQ